jgi:NADH-quinone oxidoreductase subunit E
LRAGRPVKPGSQTGRTASAPAGAPATLTDPALYDGSVVGAWRQRFEAKADADVAAAEKPPEAADAKPAPAGKKKPKS